MDILWGILGLMVLMVSPLIFALGTVGRAWWGGWWGGAVADLGQALGLGLSLWVGAHIIRWVLGWAYFLLIVLVSFVCLMVRGTPPAQNVCGLGPGRFLIEHESVGRGRPRGVLSPVIPLEFSTMKPLLILAIPLGLVLFSKGMQTIYNRWPTFADTYVTPAIGVPLLVLIPVVAIFGVYT